MAERVGFVPGDPAPVNNLSSFSIAQIARNAQNLSIRYKTGTAAKTPSATHVAWLDADPSLPAVASRVVARSSETATVEALYPL
jgi:hypothetical protein